MAQALVTDNSISIAAETAEALEPEVRIGVHDASRMEWSVSLPMPKDEPLPYSIDVALDIPSNAFARHSPWNQIQSFTRLDASEDRSNHHQTIDALRRSALAAADRLGRASEGFARHAMLARESWVPELEKGLSLWLDVAIRTVGDVRQKVVEAEADDPPEITRERALVDEYVSVRLLEMLAGVERALETLVREATVKRREEVLPVVTILEEKIAAALSAEIAYRIEKKYIYADAGSIEALERYLDRASQLKKHFQEVLFLEPEVYELADKVHHWAAGFAALFASTWAFAWQIALLNHRPTAGSKIGSGLVMLAVIGGLVYVAKDRIKELGRTWIAGNVRRFYAQRVARFRAPARRLPGRDVIVSARESFDQVTSSRPDPLNPESGAELHGTLLHYFHKGTVHPCAALS
ncbi:MAG: hypothetical protein ACRELY_15700, partial [Polyangiaceae bacterium]